MPRPSQPFHGLWHVALNVVALEACERFYVDLLGMQVEWRPDENSVYLSGGRDNLALHRAPSDAETGMRGLDHLGYFVQSLDAVDEWCEWLTSSGVTVLTQPRTHRDGARSFYCLDPDGNKVQILYHPPIQAAAQAAQQEPSS